MEPFGAHYRAIAVSLRHCWPEKWDGEGDDFTVQQHTSDIASFIAGLQAGPSICLATPAVGISPFRVAQNFPDLIRSLILVEPGGVLAMDLETGLAPGSGDDRARPALREGRRADSTG